MKRRICLSVVVGLFLIATSCLKPTVPASSINAALSSTVAALRPFPNLIENGDFEAYDPAAKPELWRFEPSSIFLWDLFSRPGGQRSLLVEASLIPPGGATEQAEIFCRLEHINPAATHLFEGWFYRDRNIDGVYPTVSLFGREQRLSDFWVEGDWQKISLVVSSARAANANDMPPHSLKIRVPRGDYSLHLDDLSLREIGAVPVSPPDGGLVNRDSIRFTWLITASDRLLESTLAVSRDKNFGGPEVRRFQINNADDNASLLPEDLAAGPQTQNFETQSLEIPNRLGQGKWFWRIELRQYKTLLAVSKTRSFNITQEGRRPGSDLSKPTSDPRRPVGPDLAKPTSDPSRLNDELAVQGPDVFPIGLYGVPIEDYKEISEIGFNAVMSRSADMDSLLKSLAAAREDGLKVLASPDPVLRVAGGKIGEELYCRDRHVATLLAMTEECAGPHVAKPPRDDRGTSAIQNMPEKAAGWIVGPEQRKSEAEDVLGWYLEDEPEGRSVSPRAIFAKRAALSRLGFRQPGVLVLNRTWRTGDYAGAVDVIMTDPYPIPFEPLSWLSENLDEIRALVGGDTSKRAWAVIQAFGWNYGAAGASDANLGRDPTADEVRALTYLAVAHRAQGLFYYVYRSGNFSLKERTELWQGLKATVAELREISPVIQSREAGIECRMQSDRSDSAGIPAVHAIFKRYSPDSPASIIVSQDAPKSSRHLLPGLYLIAVSTLNEPVTATLDFKSRPSEAAFDVFSGEGFPFSDSRLTLEFKPLERKVLYFVTP